MLLRSCLQVGRRSLNRSRFITTKPGPFRSVTISDLPEGIGADAIVAASDVAAASGAASAWVSLSGPRQLALLAGLVQHGFVIHRGVHDSIDAYRWLLPNEPCTVPPFATHHVGVAGVVMDASGHLLMIKEHGRTAGWKFPGGLADAGEDISVTARREVIEETGIDAQFQGILAVRHAHGLGRRGDVSDLYFLCRMSTSLTRPEPRIQHTHEVAEARWMLPSDVTATTEHPMTRFMTSVVSQCQRQPAEAMRAELAEDRVGMLRNPTKLQTLYHSMWFGHAMPPSAVL